MLSRSSVPCALALLLASGLAHADDPAPAPAPAPEPASAPPPGPIEVTVVGEKAPAGSTLLRGRDLREIPGALNDPFRAIEMRPGVTPAFSGVPYFFIRGAPPADIGYFFDGVEVPL